MGRVDEEAEDEYGTGTMDVMDPNALADDEDVDEGHHGRHDPEKGHALDDTYDHDYEEKYQQQDQQGRRNT
jgi:hypothetical protein